MPQTKRLPFTDSILLLLAAVATALVTACGVPDAIRHIGERAATPHEAYAQSLRDAGLEQTALGREWLAAADTALRDALSMPLPFRETGFYDRSEARAIAWRFPAREGARLTVTVSADGLPTRLFVDLFEVTGDTAAPFRHRASARSDSMSAATLAFEARDSATFIVRLQPELLRSGRFTIDVRIDPMLAFPVDGRGNSAVQSFFGADRDGGRRAHHGIDIFAPRGTPVLAAAQGVVRSTTPNNLGGIVVWLFDEQRSQSLYYAHLDSQVVRPGQRIEIGDTLGFVGNTGNARGTRPHLHFGIYRRGRGPIDPWPYVRIITAVPAPLRADTSRLGARAAARSATVVVRTSPATSADGVREMSRDTPLRIMGASGSWFRVQLDDGVAGYVPSGAVGAASTVAQ